MIKLLPRLKRQLFRGYCSASARLHLRHYRGHGVHSPFMYGIVRNVFMKHRIVAEDHSLYDRMSELRLNKHDRILLQNLYTFHRRRSLCFDGQECLSTPSAEQFCILTPEQSEQWMEVASHLQSQAPSTLVLLAAHRNLQHYRTAQRLCKQIPCVSVDRRRMMLLFFDPTLHPQHYRI